MSTPSNRLSWTTLIAGAALAWAGISVLVMVQVAARRRRAVRRPRGTFSTATLFAAAVKERGIGALVGRETGSPTGVAFGEKVPTRLPNSGLLLLVASTRYQFGKKPPGWPSRGVVPDHRVPRKLPARVRGTNPILERARALGATSASSE